MITDIFNSQDIPRLDRNAPGFGYDKISLIRDSRLVMIFDRAANPNTIASEVVEAQEKSYIQNFILVSRDNSGTMPVYRKIEAHTPYWSGDAMASAVAKGNAYAQWRREFLNHIVRQWDKMHQPSAATVTFSKSFTITSEMTDKEKDDLAYDGLHKAIQAQLDAGEKKLKAAEREYAFDGKDDASMVHRALASVMQRPQRLESFIYLPAEMNVKYMQERLVRAANLFQIPAGTDFNGKPLIAFPGDDAVAADLNTKAALKKLSL